jgi:perosamine synthetase
MDLRKETVLASWPSWPQYGPREVDAVARVVKSQQLFAAAEVKTFEADFASFQGSKIAIGMGNATQGLHLALAALNVGEGDEVIVTPCSWISSSSCVLMQNAIPVFADIESESLGLDPDQVESKITEKTKAIIMVHILGYPAKIAELSKIAKKYSIPLIEDASHAPGAEVNGKKIGTFGEIGVFSLQQRKAISTGDGGVICTDNLELAEKIRRLRSFGHEELSYNYRMTEFSAALGRLGLERLDSENLERRQAAEWLSQNLVDLPWIKVRLVRQNEIGVYYAVALEVNLTDENSTDLIVKLNELGYPIRKAFEPLNRHPHFNPVQIPARGLPWISRLSADNPDLNYFANLDLPVAYEYCYGRVLELYAHPGITLEQLSKFRIDLIESYKQLSINGSRKNW